MEFVHATRKWRLSASDDSHQSQQHSLSNLMW
jgi:hypothetical protein